MDARSEQLEALPFSTALKYHGRELLMGLLHGIPVAIFGTFVVWAFGSVFVQAINYFDLLPWVYILMQAVGVVQLLVALIHLAMWAKRRQVEFMIFWEAVEVMGLHRAPGFDTWSPESFRDWVAVFRHWREFDVMVERTARHFLKEQGVRSNRDASRWRPF